MPLNRDAFDRAIIKAIKSDLELLIPQYINTLKQLLGDDGKHIRFDDVCNELFVLELYCCSSAFSRHLRGYEGESTDRFIRLVEGYLGEGLSQENVCLRMAKILQRLLEYSEKLKAFMHEGSDHSSQIKLAQYLTGNILGERYTDSLQTNVHILTYFGSSMKSYDEYFEKLGPLIRGEVTESVS